MFLKNLCYINIFNSVTTDSKTGNVKLSLNDGEWLIGKKPEALSVLRNSVLWLNSNPRPLVLESTSSSLTPSL